MREAPNSLISTCADQLKYTLESMVGLDWEIHDITRPNPACADLEIYSGMNLDGDVPGCIMIGLNRKLAITIVSEMLMAEPDEIEDDLLDGIGELLNVIAGNAKTTLQPSGISILLRTPEIGEGAPPKTLENVVAPGVLLCGTVSGEPLSMWVWLPGVDENLPVLEQSQVEPEVDATAEPERTHGPNRPDSEPPL